MRRFGIGLIASLALACSDDGVPADTDSQTDAGDDGTGDDGSATAPTATADDSATATATDPSATATATDSDSADDGASSTEGTGSPTTGTTGDDTSGDSSSSDTGPGPADACMTEADCVIVDDCCNCMAIPADEEPPECDIVACLQSTCSAIGVPPVVACELGSCELAPVPCNPFDVTCDSLPPECDDGFVPGVNPEAGCWTNTCVPAELCDIVPSCADCPDDETCVEYFTQLGPQFHCSPVPESCDGTPSCACMGEACVSPFDSCGDGDMGSISCSCPVCG